MTALCDFYYNGGAGLSWFSVMVSNALAQLQPTRQIIAGPQPPWAQHGTAGIDMHEWDNGYQGFAYGRYLTYINSTGINYPFWLGLYFDHREVKFGIWFDTTSQAMQAVEQNLHNNFPPDQLYSGRIGNRRGIYVWMDPCTNDGMLQGNYSPRQCVDAIYNFINDVLNRV